MESTDLAELLSGLVEAAAAGSLADDDAHVIGNTLVFRHPGHDMTVRSARRRAIAVVDGEPLELGRAHARRIVAVFPKAVAVTSARRARVAERSVHVRVASSTPVVAPRSEVADDEYVAPDLAQPEH
jgi:hypothetical protein